MVKVDYISHSVGDKPTNPIVYDNDKWVYCIDSIEEEFPPEEQQSDLKHWRYHVNEKLTTAEYMALQQRRIEELSDALIEMDGD